MNFHDKLIIAIDFDGTIVEDGYPKIGKPRIFAFETLQKLQEDGHRLILWTYRSSVRLEEAVEFCKKNANPGFEKTQYRIRIFLCAIFWDLEPALPVSGGTFYDRRFCSS